MEHVSISSGNIKMGQIPSVSLPSVTTCRHCDCIHKCYAKKLERIRPTVRDSYIRNLKILQEDPDTFWREVEGNIMMSRYFRFHVSGDIPDQAYFSRMVVISRRNPHCEILCFTKKFGIVNEIIANLRASSSDLPSNLHIVFSAWPGLTMENPYDLPTAHVLFRDGTTTASPAAKACSGNCTECAITDGGCWTLKHGEEVVFHEH